MSGSAITDGQPQERTLSRIGRKVIPLPQGVVVEVGYGEVTVKGPMGTVTQTYHPEVEVKVEDGAVLVERWSARKFHHALHGLTRSLIANSITGVTITGVTGAAGLGHTFAISASAGSASGNWR